ncbi:MAG TPA: penicillin acylase family protein, partial [Caldilineaceae bacterium]|nr:penicillin acylase family protein [Caldilineaceae bacterium]
HPDQLSAEAQAVLPVSGADVVTHVTRVLALWVSRAGCKEVTAGLMSNEEAPASNGWALAPAYTTSDNAMLLVNPHVSWIDNALTLYEAHLNLPTANIYGATFVGFPTLL